MTSRRDFLRLGVGAAGAMAYGSLPASIKRALATPAASIKGTIEDVQHVVVLMQENRSFDHYFGTLKGVRGFGDPHPIPLPSGEPVWHQRDRDGELVTPFVFDSSIANVQRVPYLPHGWGDAQGASNNGRWDQWIPNKTPLTMGYFRREDIPFQFALAEAFTICDAYFCSVYGSTTPNRIFLIAGTNDPRGEGGGPVIDNGSGKSLPESSRFQGKGNGYGFGPRYTFTTYPERLEKRGISWKIYQDPNDNLEGLINPLVAFKQFSGASSSSALWRKGMSRCTLDDLRSDIARGNLPSVSWVFPSSAECEHPYSSSPVQGAEFIQRVLDILTENPEVWGKTVLFLTFDENDGFFDHVPSPAAPTPHPDGTWAGGSTVDFSGEIHAPDGLPYGLGPRVPMYVISPWSKGGWVSSEVFDHTSIIRFLERRFNVWEPNISAWRRSVCGDLTSAFDFTNGNMERAVSPSIGTASRVLLERLSKLPIPAPPAEPEPLYQEPGFRPSRPLPYELSVHAEVDPEGRSVSLLIINSGKAGAVLIVYDRSHPEKQPRRYTVGAGKSLKDQWSMTDVGDYDLRVFGPNGFLRGFSGALPRLLEGANPEILLRYDLSSEEVLFDCLNSGVLPCTISISANAYSNNDSLIVELLPGKRITRAWPIHESACWYDFTARYEGEKKYMRHFAGRMENGAGGISDPAMGQKIMRSV